MVSTSKSKVCFFYDSVRFSFPNRAVLKKFIEAVLKKEKKKLISLNYIFCTDKRLLEINKQYLKHDYYTDIITFDLSGSSLGIEGEIYISIDRVKNNAANLGVSFSSEFKRVVFHGALHLCGYKDKKKSESLKMRALEEKYLLLYKNFHVKRGLLP